ncbi:MAG: VanW family protein [Chloroflexota bacterium]
MRRALRLAVLLAVVFSLLLPAPLSAEDLPAQIGAKRIQLDSRHFAATGHNVSGPFLTFFDRWGGIDAFGYPRTEAFVEDGREVQYFQRARFEFWPENQYPWQVQLTLLGDLVLEEAEPPAPPPSDPSRRYYPQTGHSLGPPFRALFDSKGDVTIFGYPTSEPYLVGDVMVQRFQRARMEYRPNNPPAYQVQLGLLGDEYIYRLKMVPPERLLPAPEVADAEWYIWGAYTTDMAGFIPQKTHNNEVAAKAVDGAVIKPGQVFGFGRVLYVPGYVKGLGYGAHNEYVWVHAGGTCAGATTFYRAAFNAGLPILQAVEHTLESYYPFGWDATIQEGGQDVRVLNDTKTELRVRAFVDVENRQMHYWIEGREPPDRTVVRRGPYQRGEFTYEVFRDIHYANGRVRTEQRVVNYVGKPPTVIPPYPGG